MKKTCISLTLALVTTFLYASGPAGIRKDMHICNKGISKLWTFHKNVFGILSRPSENYSCTVTLTASVGYSSTYVMASCSSTRTTCDAAIIEASNCVKSALASARKNIK